jgi:hypothetical protein
MNLKNSWKEIRIWLGWKKEEIRILWAVFVVSMFILGFIFRESSFEGILFLAIYGLTTILIFIVLMAIKKMPQNWRMVIDKAREVQERYGANEKICASMEFTEIYHNATDLYERVLRYEYLNAHKEELARSQQLVVSETTKQDDLIVRIRKLTEYFQ